MARILNINKEIQDLREEVMSSFKTNLVDKQFSAEMILALVWLHLVVKRIERSQELNERKNLLKDFSRGKKAVKKVVQLLNQTRCSKMRTDDSKDSFQAEPAYGCQERRTAVR